MTFGAADPVAKTTPIHEAAEESEEEGNGSDTSRTPPEVRNALKQGKDDLRDTIIATNQTLRPVVQEVDLLCLIGCHAGIFLIFNQLPVAFPTPLLSFSHDYQVVHLFG